MGGLTKQKLRGPYACICGVMALASAILAYKWDSPALYLTAIAMVIVGTVVAMSMRHQR